MSRYRKLAINTLIYGIGNITSKLISVIMLPFFTRYLAQSEYGIIELLTTTLLIVMPLFSGNIVNALVRFTLDKDSDQDVILSNSFFVGVFGWVIMIFFYPLLSLFSFIKDFTLLFYIIFLLQVVEAVLKQFSRSINLNKVYMFSDILYATIFAVSGIVFIMILGLKVKGYLFAMIMGWIFNIFYIAYKTRFINRFKLKYINKKIIKEMLVFSLPLIPNSIFWWIIGMSNRYFVLYYIGLSASGLYSIANKIPTLITFLHRIFFTSWEISAIEEYDSKDKDVFYSKIFNLFYFFMINVVSCYISVNKFIMRFLVSPSFYSSWKYAPILVFATIFFSFATFLGTNYVASKETKKALTTTLLASLINIFLNFVMIPSYGLYGASFSLLISYFFLWVIRVFDTKRYIKIRYPFFRIVVSLIIVSLQLYLHYILPDKDFLVGAISLIFLIFISWSYFYEFVSFIWRKAKGFFTKF